METISTSVMVLSGGMDSTTLLYKLLSQGKKVAAISFNYGQRRSLELTKAAITCKKLGLTHEVVDISSITHLISHSSLTSDTLDVPDGHYSDVSMKNTFVPNRNMIMASIAIGYAVNIGANEVALGIHTGDHAIYPDCRPAFIEALDHIAQISNYEPITVYAPYSNDVDKGDIVIEGLRLGVDYADTMTCYKGGEKPCGTCGSCVERLLAFAKAREVLHDDTIRDPVYESIEVFEQYLMKAEELEGI